MDERTVHIIIASIVAVLLVGCAPAPAFKEAPAPVEQAAVEKAVEGEAPAAPDEAWSKAAGDVAAERLIIRDASLEVVVPDTEEAVDEIKGLADELGGYVVRSNVRRQEEGLKAHLKLRVPAESLESALEQIRGLATEVRRESISGQDVTEEYVDLKSRLRHLEATEERLLEFLEEAEDTEAALSVYDRLETIQADIEQVKGRMQYLEQSAAMATITLDVVPDELAQPIRVGGWHPEGTLRKAIERLVLMLQFLVDASIIIVVDVIPILVAIAIPFVGLFLLVRAIVRRWRGHKRGNEEEEQ